jgi:hypothetical protein
MAETLRDCPYLGMVHDQQTKTSYPSVLNYCHHAKPVDVVRISYQNDYCLTGQYPTCPVFMRDKKGSLPRELRASPSQISNQRKVRRSLILIVIVVILALVITLLGLFFLNQLVIPPPGGRAVGVVEFTTNLPTATQTSTPFLKSLPSASASVKLGEIASDLTFTQTASVPIEQSASPILTSTRSQTPTRTIISTRTPTRTATTASQFRRLDKTIGKDYSFIIHIMQTGENLSQFANKYETSIEAILRVNYSLNIPVWVGALVVIPVGFTDVAQMPYFQPSMITTGGITIEALAIELDTNLSGLIYYNDFKPGERLNPGDWVLIPRTQSAS